MNDEDGLAVVLSEFARTLVTDFPIQGILDHLVRRIVDLLPIDAAGVSLISPTMAPHLVAGSDESAYRYEHLQTVLGDGPCVAAYRTDGPIVIPDLREDDRFPTFARQATAEGLAAVFTFPLRNDDRCLGALDLYRTTPGRLDPTEMATAQTLADVATAYLLNAETRSAMGDFVASVSHELRTPMASIVGFVELLRAGEGGAVTAQQATFLDAISRNGARLIALADDLLKLSTLGDPGSHQHVPLNLVDVVRAAERTLGPAVASSGVHVAYQVPDRPVVVRGHMADLEAMVVNLMTNALKFTPDGGHVRCVLEARPLRAVLTVSDDGLGIPIGEQRNLFTRFFRSSTARQHAIEGTGLGLTIVHSIVRDHHGSISVESAHLHGSVFTVELPTGDQPDEGSDGGPDGASGPV